MWTSAGLGEYYKLSMTVGITWNDVPYFTGVGTTHAAGAKWGGPNCKECSASESWPCSSVMGELLVFHARAELLTPDGTFDDLSDDKWFGASHAASEWKNPLNVKTGEWPNSFYVAVFDYDGKCVADGQTRSRVGSMWSAIYPAMGITIHEKFKYAADNGGGWVPYKWLDGSQKLAYVTKQARSGKFYYLIVSFVHKTQPLIVDCSAEYAEPCSETNTHALVGMANADILASADESAFTQTILNIMERRGKYSSDHTNNFAIHVYDSDWGCVKSSSGEPIGPQRACPTLPPATKDGLQAASFGTWVTVAAEQAHLYVFRVVFGPPGGSFKRDIRLIVRVTAASAPAVCPANACPAMSHCSAGRCACNSGFLPKFTALPHCGEFKPASMQCDDVRGLDITSNNVNTTLRLKGIDAAKFEVHTTAKAQLANDIKEAFLANLGGYTSGDISVAFSQGSVDAFVRVVAKLGKGQELKATLGGQMAAVQLAVKAKAVAMVTNDASLLETGWTASGVDLVGDGLSEEAPKKCPPGYFCSEGLPLACLPGQFCPLGIAKPFLCSAGTIGLTIKQTSNASCIKCGVGKLADMPGMTECTNCPAGKFSAVTGQTACTRCPLGFFMNSTGTSHCLTCQNELGGSSTMYQAAESPTDCTCMANSYSGELLKGVKECVTCTLGQACNKPGLAQPNQAPGYYIHDLKPDEVYRCEPMEACLGADWGASVCRKPRFGFMCMDCPDGEMLNNVLVDDEPGCRPCSPIQFVVVLLSPFAAFCVALYIMYETPESPIDIHPIFLETQGTFGQLVMFVQVINAIFTTGMLYGDPLDKIMHTIITHLDPDKILSNAPCIIAEFGDAIGQYASMICLPVAFAILMFTAYFIANRIWPNLLG